MSKLLRTLTDPEKRVYCREQVFLWVRQAAKYRNFGLNPNTKTYWNDLLKEHGDFWRVGPYENILDMLPGDKPFSLLDIGCALGDGCELLSEKFPRARITGVDFSDVGICKARRKAEEKGLDIRYEVADVLKDPLPGEYDYITIIETLEHFYAPFRVIDKCLKHARRSVIVSVPYTPGRCSGRTYSVDPHIYTFDDNAFGGYNSRIAKKTRIPGDPMEIIIYEIFPRQHV